MKAKFKFICLFAMTAFLLGFFYQPINASAAKTYALSKKYEKQFMFAVPGGGWSSIFVDLTYTERYTKYNSDTNKFYSRECTFAYKSAAVTTKPVGRVVAIKHFTSSGGELHHFTTWNDLDVIFPTGYTSIWSKQNGKNKFYATTTKSYAHVAFEVSCNGASIPIRADGLKLDLGTS